MNNFLLSPKYPPLPTHEQWQLLQPLFAAAPIPPRRRPRSADERRILGAVLLKLSTGIPWYDLPPCCPSYQVCYRHYRHWRSAGLFSRILALLAKDLFERGGFNLRQALADGQISIFLHGSRWRFEIPEHLSGGWQLETARALLGAVHKQKPPTAP